MFRAIANFTIGTNSYQVGDTIADSDNEALSNDPHNLQFVVRIANEVAPTFPTP